MTKTINSNNDYDDDDYDAAADDMTKINVLKFLALEHVNVTLHSTVRRKLALYWTNYI